MLSFKYSSKEISESLRSLNWWPEKMGEEIRQQT